MNDRTFGLDVRTDRATVAVQNDTHWAALDVDLEALAPDLLARVGDRQPCVVLFEPGGYRLRPAHQLYVDAVARALAVAGSQLRAPLDAPVALAVPSWWTDRARSWTRTALAERGLADVRIVDAGVAAVLGARADDVRVPDDVLVLDLGERSCSAVVVAADARGARPVPGTSSVHLQGGAGLDRRLLHQVLASLAELGVELDPQDREHVQASAAYLDSCRRLRHDLSTRSAVTAEPGLPGVTQRVRIVREEFEELVRPWRNEVLRIADTALAQSPRPVGSVLLVGGLSATPLVGQSLSAELDLDVLSVEDPATVVAYGAARIAKQEYEPVSSWARGRARMSSWLPWLSARPAVSGPAPRRLALPPAASAPSELTNVEVAAEISAERPVATPTSIPVQRLPEGAERRVSR